MNPSQTDMRFLVVTAVIALFSAGPALARNPDVIEDMSAACSTAVAIMEGLTPNPSEKEITDLHLCTGFIAAEINWRFALCFDEEAQKDHTHKVAARDMRLAGYLEVTKAFVRWTSDNPNSQRSAVSSLFFNPSVFSEFPCTGSLTFPGVK